MTYDVTLWKPKRGQRCSDGLIALLLSEGVECPEAARFPKSATVRRFEEAFGMSFDELPFEVGTHAKSMTFGLSHGDEGTRHLQLISDIARESGLQLYDFQTQAPTPEDTDEFERRMAGLECSEERYFFLDALALAEKGDPNGMHKLADFYRCGTGVKKDQETAIKWYQQAIDAGSNRALLTLAEMFIQERGDPNSIEKGIALVRKGVELEHAPSITFLGEILRDGLGNHVPDLAAAIELWNRLLTLEPWVGAYELARVYESGQGVSQSTEKAIEYFKIARIAGHPDAYRNLRRLGAEP